MIIPSIMIVLGFCLAFYLAIEAIKIASTLTTYIVKRVNFKLLFNMLFVLATVTILYALVLKWLPYELRQDFVIGTVFVIGLCASTLFFLVTNQRMKQYKLSSLANWLDRKMNK